MEFIIEYYENYRWFVDSSFYSSKDAEKIFKKNVKEMPELGWKISLIIKLHDSTLRDS
jgi:hypothetical protein